MPYTPDAINKIAEDNQIINKDEVDTFRHMYAAATSTGILGESITRMGGEIIEAGGMLRFYYKSFRGQTNDTWTDADNDRYKDFYNNELGIKIGQTSSSEAEIIAKIKQAIQSGEAIIDPKYSRARFEKDFPDTAERISSSMNFVASDEPSRTGGFDTGSLIRALTGGKSQMSSRQIFAMSATAFAQQVIKSRRRSLENDLLDIFTGGNGKTTLPQVGSGNPLGSFTNSFGGLIDNLVGSAMSRRKTRISTTESERSIEASRNWNISRSQQQAMLAQWANQGNRNL